MNRFATGLISHITGREFQSPAQHGGFGHVRASPLRSVENGRSRELTEAALQALGSAEGDAIKSFTGAGDLQ